MLIRLQNIGIIRDSTLALDGLTVIAGRNGSGKTTVGKTLYAMLDAVMDLQEKSRSDRSHYVENQLDEVEAALSRGFFYDEEESGESGLSGYPALETLLFGEYEDEVPPQEMEDFARQLEEELRRVDSALMEPYRSVRRIRVFDKETDSWQYKRVSGDFDVQRQQALELLENLFAALDRDPELVNYARESVNQTLRAEFSGQIQPAREPDAVSRVELFEEGEGGQVYFHFSVQGDNVVDDGEPVFGGVPVRKVYMIDDPFVLDARPSRSRSRERTETWLDPNRILTHNQKLREVLRAPARGSIFERTVLDEDLKTIRKRIDGAVAGSFEFSRESDYYVHNGAKVRLANMAAGAKMFSIIKLLLEKGGLDRSAVLILDEPESHLHPQWQNVFAEVIVLLVRELNVRVLLTTHSPNFLLALDAYTRRHDMMKRTNFYQTELMEDGFVRYRCVNRHIELIYDDFLRYLSEMKELRDRYIEDGEEDGDPEDASAAEEGPRYERGPER